MSLHPELFKQEVAAQEAREAQAARDAHPGAALLLAAADHLERTAERAAAEQRTSARGITVRAAAKKRKRDPSP